MSHGLINADSACAYTKLKRRAKYDHLLLVVSAIYLFGGGGRENTLPTLMPAMTTHK